MSKQVLVVSSQPRSVLGRVILVLLGVGLAIWFFKAPAEAAHWVKSSAGAIGTFISSVFG